MLKNDPNYSLSGDPLLRNWSKLVYFFTALALTSVQASASSFKFYEVRNICSELLSRNEFIEFVDVQGAPGLRMLSSELHGTPSNYQSLLRAHTDAFYTHELVSSAKYARLINQRRSESLLMVPDIDHRDVPGYDGVIFDSRGKPIANLSLKTLVEGVSESAILHRAGEGVKQAKKFSFFAEWVELVRGFLNDDSGKLELRANGRPVDEFNAARSWLAKSVKIFGLGMRAARTPPRPTRIVVDVQSDADLPDERDTEHMRRWVRTSRGLIESITILKGNIVLVIK